MIEIFYPFLAIIYNLKDLFKKTSLTQREKAIKYLKSIAKLEDKKIKLKNKIYA